MAAGSSILSVLASILPRVIAEENNYRHMTTVRLGGGNQTLMLPPSLSLRYFHQTKNHSLILLSNQHGRDLQRHRGELEAQD